jgi:UDP-N-acetylglucosamine 4,6-dehydratase
MLGGEIFVPKIPSMRLVDLAKAICPDCEHEIVGIRPGEKLHELLITRDDARHTLEFDDYFVIRPAVHFWDEHVHTHYGGQEGRPVVAEFEYASNSNDRWIDAAQLKAFVE